MLLCVVYSSFNPQWCSVVFVFNYMSSDKYQLQGLFYTVLAKSNIKELFMNGHSLVLVYLFFQFKIIPVT